MVNKERLSIPRPKSAFFSVTCVKCGTENVLYSNSARDVTCRQCGSLLARKTGGRVALTENLTGEIKRLDV